MVCLNKVPSVKFYLSWKSGEKDITFSYEHIFFKHLSLKDCKNYPYVKGM
jgi:hypothetical protein